MNVGKSFVPNVSSLLLEQCSQTCNADNSILGCCCINVKFGRSQYDQSDTHTNPENSHKTSPLQLSYNTTESLEFVDPPCFVHSPVDKMNHGMIYLFL
jgi:hypothetical protein